MRVFFLTVMAIIESLAGALVWQPNRLKTPAVDYVIKQATASSPYGLTIGKVTGNLISGITLQDIRLAFKAGDQEILRAPALELRVDWRALLHRQIQLTLFDLVHPVIHIPLDQTGRPHLPPFSTTSRGKSEAFAIQSVRVEGGQLTILGGHKELIVRDVELQAALTSQAFELTHLDFRLREGTARLQGRLVFHPSPAGRWILVTRDFPLEKVLPLVFRVPDALHLSHSGKWVIIQNETGLSVAMQGQLEQSPVSLHLRIQPGGLYSGDAALNNAALYRMWQESAGRNVFVSGSLHITGQGDSPSGAGNILVRYQPPSHPPLPLVRAHMDFARGLGDFEILADTDIFKLAFHGSVDLPRRRIQSDYVVDISSMQRITAFLPELKTAGGRIHLEGHAAKTAASWSVDGRGTGDKLEWEGHPLDRLEGTFAVSPEQDTANLTADHLRFQQNIESSRDIEHAVLTLSGRAPSWQSTAAITLHNGTTLAWSGPLTRGADFWQLSWQTLSLALPATPSWTGRPNGSFTWWNNRRAEVRGLYLESESQSLQISSGTVFGDFYTLNLAVQNLKLEPWAKEVPGLSADGTLNASLMFKGTASQVIMNGYVKGNLPTLASKPWGASVRNLDIDIEASGQTVDIRRFNGKTKKGEIQFTGKSRLPELSYALQANNLTFQPTAHSQATCDVQLALGGTWSLPTLDGQVQLKDAIYSPEPPTRKKPADQNVQRSTESKTFSPDTTTDPSLWRRTAVDVSAKWLRNVWYRDAGTDIETQGDLRLQKYSGQKSLLFTGTINSVRGTYSYYGRSFDIASAQMQFTGALDNSPLLKAEATYQGQTTTVYLDVTGTLSRPELKLRSNPPLTQQDIVSVIVFGAPLNELHSTTGGTTTNQAMMQAAGSAVGGYVSNELRQTGLGLNLDVLNVQAAPEGVGSQLMMGRYVTKRLFVSYGQAVQGSAEKTIMADYFLTRRWTLEGTSDSIQGNYLDLLFRFPILTQGGAVETGSPLPVSPFRGTLDIPNPELLGPMSR